MAEREQTSDAEWRGVASWVLDLTAVPWQAPSVAVPEYHQPVEVRSALVADYGVEVLYDMRHGDGLVNLLFVGSDCGPGRWGRVSSMTAPDPKTATMLASLLENYEQLIAAITPGIDPLERERLQLQTSRAHQAIAELIREQPDTVSLRDLAEALDVDLSRLQPWSMYRES